MKKLRIKFKKHYNFYSDRDNGKKCGCTITVELPVVREEERGEEREEIHPLLRDRNRTLLDTRLSAYWGSWKTHEEGYDRGKKSIYLSASSWEELEEKIEEKIEESIEILKDVKEENEGLLGKIPEDETVVVVI